MVLKFKRCRYIDWPKLIVLMKQLFPEEGLRAIFYHIRHSKEKIQIAYVDDEMAGFFLYTTSTTNTDITWLNYLGVKSGYNGNGVGRGLLEKLDEETKERGFSRIELAVSRNNERAIRLYERSGYQRLVRNGETEADKLTYYKEV